MSETAQDETSPMHQFMEDLLLAGMSTEEVMKRGYEYALDDGFAQNGNEESSRAKNAAATRLRAVCNALEISLEHQRASQRKLTLK